MERPWEGKSVVIVEDHDETRRQLKSLYIEVGLNVVGEAKDGLEALEIVAATKPDLVSLDIIMPNMDGIECYRRLREKHQHTQLFFVSALSSEHRVTECFAEEIGLERFIQKPVKKDVLESRLAGLYGLSLPAGASNDKATAFDIPVQ